MLWHALTQVSSRAGPKSASKGHRAILSGVPSTMIAFAWLARDVRRHFSILSFAEGGQSSLVFIRPIFPSCWCGSCRPLLRVLAGPPSCLPVRQHFGADLGFQHLADLGARKVIPDFNLFGGFDAPDPLLHEGRYRGDIDGASR